MGSAPAGEGLDFFSEMVVVSVDFLLGAALGVEEAGAGTGAGLPAFRALRRGAAAAAAAVSLILTTKKT